MVTVDVKVNTGGADINNTDSAFKNCAPFSACKTGINYVFIDEANHIYSAMPMYNLIEYCDNYSYKLGSLWQFKKDKFQLMMLN